MESDAPDVHQLVSDTLISRWGERPLMELWSSCIEFGSSGSTAGSGALLPRGAAFCLGMVKSVSRMWFLPGLLLLALGVCGAMGLVIVGAYSWSPAGWLGASLAVVLALASVAWVVGRVLTFFGWMARFERRLRQGADHTPMPMPMTAGVIWSQNPRALRSLHGVDNPFLGQAWPETPQGGWSVVFVSRDELLSPTEALERHGPVWVRETLEEASQRAEGRERKRAAEQRKQRLAVQREAKFQRELRERAQRKRAHQREQARLLAAELRPVAERPAGALSLTDGSGAGGRLSEAAE